MKIIILGEQNGNITKKGMCFWRNSWFVRPKTQFLFPMGEQNANFTILGRTKLEYHK